MVLTRNNIHACQTLGRPILTLEVDSEIFDEPLLDADSGKTIVCFIFNLNDDSPIQKRTKLTLIVNKFGMYPFIYAFLFFLMFSPLSNVLVFVYKEAIGSKTWNVLFFVHPDFIQNHRQSFILPSCAEASTLALANTCSISPSLELRFLYHHGVGIFIDDEARKASVQDVFGFILPLIVLFLYLTE